jgi:hypothetical protein
MDIFNFWMGTTVFTQSSNYMARALTEKNLSYYSQNVSVYLESARSFPPTPMKLEPWLNKRGCGFFRSLHHLKRDRRRLFTTDRFLWLIRVGISCEYLRLDRELSSWGTPIHRASNIQHMSEDMHQLRWFSYLPDHRCCCCCCFESNIQFI